MADLLVNGSAKNPASPGRDLPLELLEAGWRKFYSKREQRPYFFNKFTNQSLWDEPTLEVMISLCLKTFPSQNFTILAKLFYKFMKCASKT